MALGVAGLPATVRAQADPLGHEDRADSLYRVFVSLDGEGHPLLPLAVLQSQQRLEVSAPTGLRVIGTGDGSVEFRVPGDRPMSLEAGEFQPGDQRFYVALGTAPADDLTTLRALRQTWKERGLPTRHFGVGATYGLKGRVLDTRRTVMCLDSGYPDAASARHKAEELAQSYPLDPAVHVQLIRPPKATLRARSPEGHEVRAADVIWFEALRDERGRAQPLQLVGHGKGKPVKLSLPGRVYVMPDANGQLTVVNEARIESILTGVVAAEIFASAPLEALKAQAVAARTDMLAKVGQRHRSDPFSICSEVHCQAYRGMKRVSPRIVQAVEETRGLVLTDATRGGRLVDAFYCAASGGHTENNENAWHMTPHATLRGQPDLQPGATDHLKGVPDDDAIRAHLAAPDRSYASAAGLNKQALRWQVTRTQAALRASLVKKTGIDKPVQAIAVLSRGVSGRATAVELTLQGGDKRTILGELRIRRAFGGLRSSLFVLDVGAVGPAGVPASFTFTGAGYGHGVGMDQTGAMGRAKLGQSFQQITAHYYPGSKLEKLY